MEDPSWTNETLIDDSAAELKLETAFRKCDEGERDAIVGRIENELIQPRPARHRVWWQQVRNRLATHVDSLENFHKVVAEIGCTGASSCWFLVDPGERWPMAVYEATVDSVVAVTQNSAYVEYCLVTKDFEWLLASTEHGQLILGDNDRNYEEA